MKKTYGIDVYSTRFDQTSILPENLNAGNKFYGADFVQYIKDALNLADYSIVDEDWGWLVYGKTNEFIIHYGVGDWHDIDNRFGGKPKDTPKTEANWHINISAFRSNKLLGFIPYNSQIDCPLVFGDALVAKLIEAGDKVICNGLE